MTNNNYAMNRRISDDNSGTRDSTENKQVLGHKRSCSTDVNQILSDLPSTGHTTADDNEDENQETISNLLRNFNAYLVLEERHYPGQPDITNSESVILIVFSIPY